MARLRPHVASAEAPASPRPRSMRTRGAARARGPSAAASTTAAAAAPGRPHRLVLTLEDPQWVEAVLLASVTAVLAMRLLQTPGRSAKAAAALALTLAGGVLAVVWAVPADRQRLLLVPPSSHRLYADAGLPYACLLVPLLAGGRYLAAQAADAAASPGNDETRHTAAYLAYLLHLSLALAAGILCHAIAGVYSSHGRTTSGAAAAAAAPTLPKAAAAVAASVALAVAWVALTVGWQDHLAVHTALVALGMQALLHLLLLAFPRSFTVGEAALWALFVSMLAGDALAATIQRARLWTLPAFMTMHRTPVHLFLASLVLGIIGIGLLLAPLLHHIQRAAQVEDPRAPRWRLGYTAYAARLSIVCIGLVIAIVLGIISPWMRLFLRQDPFLWTFAFLGEGWRMPLALYWAAAIAGSVTLLAVRDQYRTDGPTPTGTSPRPRPRLVVLERIADLLAGLPVILLRKYFHVLAVLMFCPGLLIEPFFLQLAFGVALAVFIALEYCRLGNIYPIGKGLHSFLSGFTDYRDSGPFIMSHIYLLVGCALPVWFTGFPPMAYYAGFSGIISIGVGDTMASIAGLRYGRRRWPNTKKTLEGTAAGIGASVLVSAVLYLWCPASLALTPAQMIGYVVCLIVTGLMEALTQQIDNLTVPLVLLAALQLL